MFSLLDHPILLLVFSLAAFWFSVWLGASFHKNQSKLKESTCGDLTLVLGGTLTLLGLIIGFTFSMALDSGASYVAEMSKLIDLKHLNAHPKTRRSALGDGD